MPYDTSGRIPFSKVLRACTYGSAGHVATQADLQAIEEAIDGNEPILREFAELVVVANFSGEGESLRTAHDALWRARFPSCVILHSQVNRGHSIGTSDLDNLLFDYCKESGRNWLCKSAHDVRIDEAALEIPVEPAQFYYLNAVSFDGLAAHEFNLEPFCEGFLYPQTNFYAIDVRATDYLVDRGLLDRTWEVVQSTPDYSGRVWEVVPGWSCEALLRDAVRRNRLTTCSLTTADQWRQILQLVIDRRIVDCSFKGIRINGIWHAQPGYPLIATIGA